MSLCQKLAKIKNWCKGNKDDELEALKKENAKLKEDNQILKDVVQSLGEELDDANEFVDAWMVEEDIK